MCNHAPSLHQNLRRHPFHLRCFFIRRLNLQALSIWFATTRRIASICRIWGIGPLMAHFDRMTPPIVLNTMACRHGFEHNLMNVTPHHAGSWPQWQLALSHYVNETCWLPQQSLQTTVKFLNSPTALSTSSWRAMCRQEANQAHMRWHGHICHIKNICVELLCMEIIVTHKVSDSQPICHVPTSKLEHSC